MLEKKWVIQPLPPEEEIEVLQESLKISKALCALLINRGIKSFEAAKAFFRPDLKNLHDPFLMKNMDTAVSRVIRAIQNKERILIYGDYDVDGTTAVTIAFDFLSRHTNAVEFYIPDRYKEGYGISEIGIHHAHKNGCTLIIALDCGIKAHKQASLANSLGIDLIVCDHHLPGETLPQAIVLNPKQNDCTYPFKELSGAGVGFKLVSGICLKLGIDQSSIWTYLDLLAISIGADLVPIQDENRTLALLGMEKINSTPRIGIKAILQSAQIDRAVTMRDIGFQIGPRINAAGRIDHAGKAVELLLSNDQTIAEFQSRNLSDDNQTRQELDAQTLKEALAKLNSDEKHQTKHSTVVYDDHWNKGILGIVASKLQETYYRPTIVLTKSEGLYTGSARSVEGFNLYNAIEPHKHLLKAFGGHAYAAGLSVEQENLQTFIQAFEQSVAESILPHQKIPTIHAELELPVEHISIKFFKILQQFEPFGQGNPQPTFIANNVVALKGIRVMGKDHLKFEVSNFDQSAPRITAVGFKKIQHYDNLSKGLPFSMAYHLEMNEWKGKKSLQILIQDIKF